MNVCLGKDLIKEKTAKKFEIIFFRNKFKLKNKKYLTDGLEKQQIL